MNTRTSGAYGPLVLAPAPCISVFCVSFLSFCTVQYSMVQYSTVTGEEDGVRGWLTP